MVDIPAVLAALAKARPLFHSEADFQHALAWEIHRRLPTASIRLELPSLTQGKSIHLDILATQDGTSLAFELKYKTRGLSARVRDEQFVLSNHSAQDQGRYDFVKDIQRLEQVTESRRNTVGYAIFLTNDSAYWTRQRDRQPVDAAFRLDQGRSLHGELGWGAGASEGTKRGREEPLRLRGSYPVNWQDYSKPSTGGYGVFRCVVVEVR